MSALEHACNNENNLPQLATHMLVFMVRGICSALKFPYAQFPVKASSGCTLHPIVWECVEHLESIGLKVLAFVSDGASCNRTRCMEIRDVKAHTRSKTFMQKKTVPFS